MRKNNKVNFTITEVSNSFVVGKIDLHDMNDIVYDINLEVDKVNLENGKVGNENGEADVQIRSGTVAWLTKSKKSFKKIRNIVQEINDLYFQLDISTKPDSHQYTLYEDPFDHYDWHQDHYKKEDQHEDYIRTLSLSLCLTPSELYEGAELFIRDGNKLNVRIFKMGFGEFVIFPANVKHRVNALRNGERESLVVWYGYEK